MKKFTLTLVMISSLLFAKSVQTFPSAMLDTMKKYPKTTATIGGTAAFFAAAYVGSQTTARSYAPVLFPVLTTTGGFIGSAIHSSLTPEKSILSKDTFKKTAPFTVFGLSVFAAYKAFDTSGYGVAFPKLAPALVLLTGLLAAKGTHEYFAEKAK